MNEHTIEIPARLERAMGGAVTIDLEQRTVDATVCTRKLARDGGIVVPEGIITRAFAGNPNVLAMHGMGRDVKPPVVGRCLSINVDKQGVATRTQFAETDLGREYAYLYGVNPKREVYMRGWSFGWTTLAMRWVTIDEARVFLGSDWDEELVPPFVRRYNEVWIAERSEMLEYSAVPVGADRASLSRAWSDGVRAAGEIIAAADFQEAKQQIDELRNWQKATDARIEKYERDLMAMRRDGAAAAARGDTAELVTELRSLAASFKQ